MKPIALLKKGLDQMKGLFKKTVPSGAAKASFGSVDIRGFHPMKSVGMRLFIPVLLSIVLLVSILGLTSYFRANSIIQKKVSASSESTVQQVEAQMDLMLQNIEDQSTKLMIDPDLLQPLREYKTASTYHRFEIQSSINSKLSILINASKGGVREMFLLPVTYDSPIAVGEAGAGNEDYTKSDWFKSVVEAKGKPIWFGTKPTGILGTSKQPVFTVARLINDSLTKRADQYVLVLEVDSKILNSVLTDLKMGDTGATFLLTPSNEIVSASEGHTQDKTAPVELTKDMISNSQEKAKSEIIKNNLVIYKTLKVSDWTILSQVPIAELTKETKQIRNLTFLLVGIGLLVAIGVGWFMARYIGGPLGQMRNLMNQGARGDLTVRMNTGRQDEIGQLAGSFNIMMEQITSLVHQTNQSAAQVLQTAEELLSASKKTAGSAKEIAVATEEIANGASSLAVEAEKGNNLTYEISQHMQQVVVSNQQMGNSAKLVQQAGEQGTNYMADLAAKTNSTEEMTRSMVEKVDRLKESTSSIRKILELLNNITKQTNILSLNATIEAARAGTAGKGFMVVADEIRRLAEQSKQSIEVVGSITDTIQTEIDETVNVLSTAYPVFKEQIASVKEAELIFGQVKSHMNGFIQELDGVTTSIQTLEQSQTVLSDAMSSVSAVSEESSATSQEVASLSNEQLGISDNLVKLSESLQQLSNSLQESLSKFKV